MINGDKTARENKKARTSISKEKLAEYQWIEKTFRQMCEALQEVVQESGIQFAGNGTVDTDLIAGFRAATARADTYERRCDAAEAKLREIAFQLSLVILALEIHSPIERLKELEAIAKGE